MNETTVQMNAEQLALFKELRNEYAKQMREIANIKEFLKQDIDGFFDKMGYDKESKQEKKMVKKALVLFAKQNASDEKHVMDEAVELASI